MRVIVSRIAYGKAKYVSNTADMCLKYISKRVCLKNINRTYRYKTKHCCSRMRQIIKPFVIKIRGFVSFSDLFMAK